MSSAGRVGLDRVTSGRIVLIYDVSAITGADEGFLDRLARLLLAAHRIGVSIELRHACPELVDLITLVGLAGELALETRWEAEQCEEICIHEEVDPGDRAV